MHLLSYASALLLTVSVASAAAFPNSPTNECHHTTCQQALEEYKRHPHHFCYESILRPQCNTHQPCEHCKAIAAELSHQCNIDHCPKPAKPVTITHTKTITHQKPANTVYSTKLGPTITLTKAAVTITKTKPAVTKTTTKAATTITKTQPALTSTITQAATTIINSLPAVTLTATNAAATITLTKAAITVTATESQVLGTNSYDVLTVTQTLSGAAITLPAVPLTVTVPGLSGSCSPLASPESSVLGAVSSVVGEISSSAVAPTETIKSSAAAEVSSIIDGLSSSVLAPIETAKSSVVPEVSSITGNVSSTAIAPIETVKSSASTEASSIVNEISSAALAPVETAKSSIIGAVSSSIVAPVETVKSSVVAETSSIVYGISTSVVAPIESAKTSVIAAISSSVVAPVETVKSSVLAAATSIIKQASSTLAPVESAKSSAIAIITSTVVREPAATTSLPAATTVKTTSVCVPSPTQPVFNPSFEDDIDGFGDYTYPWTFTGNGLVESNTNNAYQSFDGTHFAVLYGRSTTTASLSQSLTDLVPSQTYSLQYYYNVEQASPQAICKLTTTINGQVVDSLTSPTVRTGRYLTRIVPYTADSNTGTLTFTLTCPRFLQLTAQSNYALDGITLTGGSDGCS